MVSKVNVDLNEFKRLYAEGLGDEEIGKALGFSNRVSGRVRKELGLAPNFKSYNKTGVDLNEFKRLYAEGMNDREIAEALGFSSPTAGKIRKDLGLPPQPGLHFATIINEVEFLKHYQQGKSTKEIASQLQVTFDYLYELMRMHKYKVNRTKSVPKATIPTQQQLEWKRIHEKRLELF